MHPPQAQERQLHVGMHGQPEQQEPGAGPQQCAHHAEEGALEQDPTGSLGHHSRGHGRPVGMLHVPHRGDGKGDPGRQGQRGRPDGEVLVDPREAQGPFQILTG